MHGAALQRRGHVEHADAREQPGRGGNVGRPLPVTVFEVAAAPVHQDLQVGLDQVGQRFSDEGDGAHRSQHRQILDGDRDVGGQ
ncbi:hypothetical protein A4G31_23910 [Mycobacterium persicum]|nr:hypothetical protein A4G31_23910 [Mycobacterium persicum]